MDNPVIVYLASPQARWDEWAGGWFRLDCLKSSLKTVKLFLPPLPVVIFHEDFDDTTKQSIHDILPNVTFELIDFHGMEERHVNTRPGSHTGLYGYCMMCRFFSGVMQAHPSIQQYTHYMRLDDDNYIVAPVPPEFLSAALAVDYTYSATSDEERRSLYDFTVEFMRKENLPLKHVPAYTTGRTPYNNFHIASLALWRHPVVARYVSSIENMNGCLAKGWPDASIHYMLINLLGPAIGLKVVVDQRISYRHNQQCVHKGPHTDYCYDGRNRQYPWGPPNNLE